MFKRIAPLRLAAPVLLAVFVSVAIGAGSGRAAETDYAAVVQEIMTRGDALVAEYRPADGLKSGDAFSRLYFDVFEASGTEFRLATLDQGELLLIESQFSQVISLCIRGASPDDVAAAWNDLKGKLAKAQALIIANAEAGGIWTTVLQSFFILLREGFEAMLIVTALVAYLQRSGGGDRVHAIWIGVGSALVASVAAAYVLAVLLRSSGAKREMIEGVTMLIAVVVLLYVSGWLLGKRHAQQWQKYVEARIDVAISTGSLFGLGAAAFLAVFREGAETILFYQALVADSDGGIVPIAMGFGAAAVVLVALYFAMRTASRRIPLRHFFTITAAILFAMAFVFAGKGVLELQIAGAVPTTALSGFPMFPLLGVFATLETVLAQMAVLATVPLAFLFYRIRGGTGAAA